MAEKDKDKEKKKQKQQKSGNHKKPKHQHPSSAAAAAPDYSFKPSSEVKGLRFGGQFIVKSFTIRRARPLELLKLLSYPPTTAAAGGKNNHRLFPTTAAFLPTNFTILAHHAWHTLTLGLGTKKSKVVVFVFESEQLKSAAADGAWPAEIPLGEVNRKLVRGLTGCELARFKFRKGCITFYVYAVRKEGSAGFAGFGEDLRLVLQSVASLNDFLDHTAMLAMPNQRTIDFAAAAPPLAVAH